MPAYAPPTAAPGWQCQRSLAYAAVINHQLAAMFGVRAAGSQSRRALPATTDGRAGRFTPIT